MSVLSSIFDSTAFQVFFAAWTGWYIWQIVAGQEGRQSLLFGAAAFGLLASMLVYGSTVAEG